MKAAERKTIESGISIAKRFCRILTDRLRSVEALLMLFDFCGGLCRHIIDDKQAGDQIIETKPKTTAQD